MTECPDPHIVRPLDVKVVGGRLRVGLVMDGRVFHVEMEVASTDSDEAILARLRKAVFLAVADEGAVARQAARVRTLLAGRTLELPRPWCPDIDVQGNRVEGHVWANTEYLVVRLRDAGREREVVVARNHSNRFSFDLGHAQLVSVTPVSADGIAGETFVSGD